MFQFRAEALILSAIVATTTLVAAPSAHAAGTPGDQCAQAIAKTLSKGVKKTIGIHAKCYKGTGSDCLPGDSAIADALADVQSGIQGSCTNTTMAQAGYGGYASGAPNPTLELAKYFKNLVGDRAQFVTNETFGSYGSVDDDGKKCILTAAKEAGKYYSGALKLLGKCVPTGCSFDFSTGAVSELLTKEIAKLDSKTDCNFSTLVGATSTAYLGNATRQLSRTVASPCDPSDTKRCAFPFPNDYFTISSEDDTEPATTTGRRVNFGAAALPRSSAAGKFVDPTRWNETDGWSVGPLLLFSNPDIDLEESGAPPLSDLAQSLSGTSPVLLLDADTCAQQLLWVERDQRGTSTADEPLMIRPAKVLADGHRYLVAIRNMKDSDGLTLPPSAEFAAYRDNTPTTILPVEARRAQMETVLDDLTDCGVDRASLYLAWDFTTQSSDSTAGRLLAMRNDAFTILGSDAPDFTVTSVVANPFSGIAKKITGTYQVPLYLNDGGDPGSTLRTDANHVPYNDGDFYTAEFECLIPSSASSATPARVSLYGHGLLGDYGEVEAGNVRDMATEHNFAFCATYWTGFSDPDFLFAAQVVLDFGNFPTFIDVQHQGILNQMFLARLMKHANGFASDPAFQDLSLTPVIDTSDVFYDGNSQGGILGGVLAAFEQDITRFSLGVPGINYSTLLNRSVDFEKPFYVQLSNAYTTSTDRMLVLSLAQQIWDRTDPNGHINHLLSNPYSGTPAKKALYSVAFGDHQVAPVTVEVAARSNGMYIHTPVLDEAKVVPDVVPYYGIPAIPYESGEFDGSAMVVWDAGNPSPPQANIPPAAIPDEDPLHATLAQCARDAYNDDPLVMEYTGDPHSCPRKEADSRVQKSEFLKTNGKIVDVCSGDACIVNP